MGKLELEFPKKGRVKWGIRGKDKKDILKTVEEVEDLFEKQN